MYCTNCGKQILDTVNFCPHCGCQINMKADASNSYYRSDGSTKGTLVTVMLMGGTMRQLYYYNGLYYYDRFLTRPFPMNQIHHAPNVMPGFFGYGVFHGFGSMVGPILFHNFFNSKH